MEYYREFWEIFEPIPANPSNFFVLKPLEENEVSLEFFTLNRYMEQSDKISSFVVRDSSIVSMKWEVKSKQNCESDVFSIVSFSDGNKIAVGCDQEIMIFELLKNEKLPKLSGIEVIPGFNYPTPIVLDPAEKFIVSAMVGIGKRNLIQLWDLEAQAHLKKPKKLGEYGSLLDYKLLFFNIFKKQEDTSIEVKSVALTPNGKIAISSSIHGIIKLWDTQGENLERGEFSSHRSEVRCLAVDSNNSILASGDVSGYIKIWNLTTLSEIEIKTLQIPSEPINTLAFSKNGKLLVAGTQQGNIKVWDTKTWEEYCNWNHPEAVNSVAFHPNGYLVASGTDDNKIIIWDVKNKKSPQKITELVDHTGAVTSVVFTPDGKKLISGGKDRQVRIWQPVE